MFESILRAGAKKRFHTPKTRSRHDADADVCSLTRSPLRGGRAWRSCTTRVSGRFLQRETAQVDQTVARAQCWGQFPATDFGQRNPNSEQVAFEMRLVVILVLAARMKHRLVVEELHVAFLKLHREPESRAFGNVLSEVQCLALYVGERQVLSPPPD
jgi:hypothetical protein